MKEGWRGIAHLFRVVDLPDEGLPTRPMRGSRGIFGQGEGKRDWVSKKDSVEWRLLWESR